jgi:hypothetical protein
METALQSRSPAFKPQSHLKKKKKKTLEESCPILRKEKCYKFGWRRLTRWAMLHVPA